MKLTLIIYFILFSPLITKGQHKRQDLYAPRLGKDVFVDSNDSNAEFYICDSSVECKNNIINVYIKEKPIRGKESDFVQSEIANRKKYNLPIKGWEKLAYVVTWRQYDCANNKEKVLAYIYVNTNNTTIKSTSDYDTIWDTIGTESMADSILNFLKNHYHVCK